MSDPQPGQPRGTDGKRVVIVMLIAGTILALILSRMMPRTNPKMADPGNPYYSPPTDAELKAMKEEERQSRARQ